MTALAPPVANGPTKRLAKRLVAPFERRIEMAVSRAVEQAMRAETVVIQEALRADVATLVELTYELQRQIDGFISPATQLGKKSDQR